MNQPIKNTSPVECDYLISAGPSSITLDNLAMVELVKEVHSMRSELYQVKSDNPDDVTKAAELLGNWIKNEGAMQRWPLDIEDNEDTIPESWSNSCQAILIGIF